MGVEWPEGWKSEKLSTVSEMKRGTTITKASSAEGKIPVVSGGQKPSFYCNLSNRDKDTISVAGSGEYAGYIQYWNEPFFANDCFTVKAKNNLVNKFLYYYLASLQNEIYKLKKGGGVPHVRIPDLENLSIPLPPLPEQHAIVEVLESFDEHINNLDALIAKKCGIRSGALEDLMSGRVRVDGFNGEWETYEFSDFFKLLPNNTLSRAELCQDGEVGNIHYGDILIKYKDILTCRDEIPRIKDGIHVSKTNFLKTNDVVLADTAEDESVGRVVQLGRLEFPIVGGLHTVVCRPMNDTYTGFLGYYMNSNCFHDKLLPYITGTKVSAISKSSLQKISLTTPSTIEEQRAIADVLTSLDEEIEVLEAERDKWHQVRAGAMGDLLSGKVRLGG